MNKEDCLDGGMKEGANPLSSWRRSLGTKNEKMDMKRPSSLIYKLAMLKPTRKNHEPI